MQALHYNYVFWNNSYMPDYNRGIVNPDDFDTLCMQEAASLEDVKVLPCQLSYSTPMVRRLQIRHERWGRKYKVPFKRIWYRFFFRDDFKNNKPYCFVIIKNRLPLDYLRFLRVKYPNCRIVKVYRDLVDKENVNPAYSEQDMNEICDARFSYDQSDCEKYGLYYFHNYCSKINVLKSEDYPLYDVFFCGTAKDRLEKLIRIYDVLSAAGLKCRFHIVFARDDEKENRDGITYSNEYMPYKEILYYSVNSRCMLDINQDNATGYTIRFLEAVMYNKRLITDNTFVRKSSFYRSDFIQVVETIDQIDPSFVLNDTPVDYNYNGEFSPVHLIELIDRTLLGTE